MHNLDLIKHYHDKPIKYYSNYKLDLVVLLQTKLPLTSALQ